MAAWVVLVCHLEVFKSHYGLKTNGWRFFTNSAQIAVTFFFVLSGFLITYLLLGEKKKNEEDRIHLWRFYKKRILRIWPLYYLLVLLIFLGLRTVGFFHDLPGLSAGTGNGLYEKRLMGYVLFLPNYTEYRFGTEPYLGQTWSLGVEEFFYLFFPLGLYFIRWKNVRKFLLILLALFFILSIGIFVIKNNSGPSSRLLGLLAIYFDKYRIYSFALGGLAAWFLIRENTNDPKWVIGLQKKITTKWLMLALLLLVGGGVTFSIATQQIYSVFFAILLYSLSYSQIRFYFLNHPIIVYLGKISYGIYMLHPLAAVILVKLVRPVSGTNIGATLLLAIGATVITIALAVLSYELYEKFFLRLKK